MILKLVCSPSYRYQNCHEPPLTSRLSGELNVLHFSFFQSADVVFSHTINLRLQTNDTKFSHNHQNLLRTRIRVRQPSLQCRSWFIDYQAPSFSEFWPLCLLCLSQTLYDQSQFIYRIFVVTLERICLYSLFSRLRPQCNLFHSHNLLSIFTRSAYMLADLSCFMWNMSNFPPMNLSAYSSLLILTASFYAQYLVMLALSYYITEEKFTI